MFSVHELYVYVICITPVDIIDDGILIIKTFIILRWMYTTPAVYRNKPIWQFLIAFHINFRIKFSTNNYLKSNRDIVIAFEWLKW